MKTKLVFYIGFHNGDLGKPTHQDEVIEHIEMDIQRAGKLLRALRGVFRYLTTGANNE